MKMKPHIQISNTWRLVSPETRPTCWKFVCGGNKTELGYGDTMRQAYNNWCTNNGKPVQ